MDRRDFLYCGALGLTWGVNTAQAIAQNPCSAACAPRQDELWVVSSRAFGCAEPNDGNHASWQVQRRETNTTWRTAQFGDYLSASSDKRLTVFYVHGNRNDWYWALRNGQTVYNALVRQCPPAEPFRFVIYSWPSDKVRGPVRDGRYKLQVADGETHRFGWLMNQIPTESQLGLIGFSLGGRIITGGLHLLAGGALSGRMLPSPPRSPARVVLWAPALHHDWLAPGRCHGQAMNQVDHLSLAYNSCDPVMKRYDLGYPGSHPLALGYVGFSSAPLGPAATRVTQCDASSVVGKSHELVQYCASESIMQDARRRVFWQT